MTDLGPEWIPDSEGIPSRDAARLVIFDGAGDVLLVHGHDTHDLQHRWWFTVGGGINVGETRLECAIREAGEETGLEIDPKNVVGPVLRRDAEFHFQNTLARQNEEFFLTWLPADRPLLKRDSLTDRENQTLDEFRWFNLSELDHLVATETVYPAGMAELVRRWQLGWDGSVIELGWEYEPDV